MIYRRLLVLLLMLMFSFNARSQEEWKLITDHQEIQVYTRSNELMDFKEFKAQLIIEASIHEVLALLYDVEALPSWGHRVDKTILLERPADTAQIYYAVVRAPWPYKDRDGIFSNKTSWDKETRTISMEVELLESYMEPVDKFERMDGSGLWKIRDLRDGSIEIIFQMQVDPGGMINAWLANMFVTDSPYFTLKGLRDIIQKGKYKGAKYNLLLP